MAFWRSIWVSPEGKIQEASEHYIPVRQNPAEFGVTEDQVHDLKRGRKISDSESDRLYVDAAIMNGWAANRSAGLQVWKLTQTVLEAAQEFAYQKAADRWVIMIEGENRYR